jgi:membrane-bound lytic murein transglycosylase D
MAKNPGDYGLENIDFEEPLEYEPIQLTAATNLNLIADATMQPLSTIRDLNPSLLKLVAPAGFRIYVPKGSAGTTQAALESVPANNRLAWRIHHVDTGDTLEAIAKTYHLSTDRILAVNRSSDNMGKGDLLLIPAAFHEEPANRSRGRAGSSRNAKALSSAFRSNSSVARRPGTHIAAQRRSISKAAMPHRSAYRSSASLSR